MVRASVSALALFLAVQASASAQDKPLQPLSQDEVHRAIAIGRSGNVPLVQIGRYTGDFDVFVESPTARIAAAAATASREYRPFDETAVTTRLSEPLYRITAERSRYASGSPGARRIVLQAKDAAGLDGVIQPVRESFGTAFFDRFPDGEFDIVIVTGAAPQKYGVSFKDRARIEGRPLEPSVTEAPTPAPLPRSVTQGRPPIRLLVQGDGSRLADAVGSLRSELSTLGVQVTLVTRGDLFDYTIVYGQAGGPAAALVALDPKGNVVAVAVQDAFTQKRAANGAAREMAQKLAAIK